MTAPALAPRPADFEHHIHVFPPVADNGVVLWFGFIDETDRWHRSFRTPEALLLAAADIMRKLLTYETAAPESRGKNPNYVAGGPHRDLPHLNTRWSIRVTAGLREEDPEWTVEILDQGSWGQSSYDLHELMRNLARRITDAGELPQPLLATTPRPPMQIAPAPSRESGDSSPESVEGFIAQHIARVDAEIAKHQKVVDQAHAAIDQLRHKRRGLSRCSPAGGRSSACIAPIHDVATSSHDRGAAIGMHSPSDPSCSTP